MTHIIDFVFHHNLHYGHIVYYVVNCVHHVAEINYNNRAYYSKSAFSCVSYFRRNEDSGDIS